MIIAKISNYAVKVSERAEEGWWKSEKAERDGTDNDARMSDNDARPRSPISDSNPEFEHSR